MRRLATPAWLARHVIMVALVALFLRLGWWQLSRAQGGNGLSIGYSLEWPAFAIFVIVVWWREVRNTLRAGSESSTPPEPPPPATRPEIPGVVSFDLEAARAERAARIEQNYRQRATKGVNANE
jgi:hypothetical protein